MEPARIAELLRPFLQAPVAFFEDSKVAHRVDEKPAELCASQLKDISTYIDILLRWNARMNLTAIRQPEEIVTRHFGESFFAARHLLSSSSSGERHPRVADIGSGAGFPGIPIKLFKPEMSVTLVESNQKKATFLREVIRALTLTDIDVENVRAESLSPGRFDVVTLRAVERFDSILPVAATLVRPGGRLVLLVGAAQANEAAAILIEWKLSKPHPIPESRSKIVLIGTRSQER